MLNLGIVPVVMNHVLKIIMCCNLNLDVYSLRLDM